MRQARNYYRRMHPYTPAEEVSPTWLWRLATRGFLLAVAAVLGLAAALALGWADPPRAGPLSWQDDFKNGAGRWALAPPAGGSLLPADGALVATFAPAPIPGDSWALGLTRAPAGDFTLEVAETAVTGQAGVRYGLVFGWQDADHYSALFINGDGYAEAFQQTGTQRLNWFEWQQWPHILFGSDTNRLRVDVRGQSVSLRINDEVLVSQVRSSTRGQIGFAARSTSLARVVFSWVRLWAPLAGPGQ
jgi:hypothetical protein